MTVMATITMMIAMVMILMVSIMTISAMVMKIVRSRLRFASPEPERAGVSILSGPAHRYGSPTAEK